MKAEGTDVRAGRHSKRVTLSGREKTGVREVVARHL